MAQKTNLKSHLLISLLLALGLAGWAKAGIELSLDGSSPAPATVYVEPNEIVDLYVVSDMGDTDYYTYMTTGTGTGYGDMDWATSNSYGAIAQPVASANAGDNASVTESGGWLLNAWGLSTPVVDGIHFSTSVIALGSSGQSFTVAITMPNDEFTLAVVITFIISEITPPSPSPMTWATPPYATGETSIAMVATTASDPSGVEYYFECTAGGGHDSNWQDGTLYEDTGLTPDTEYTYRVIARDKSPNQNATDWSGTASATTDSDLTPPSPYDMTWATPPYATGSSSIAMVATTATDPSGVEYYFECTAGGGHDSNWQNGTFYEDTGLDPGTEYTYWVKARDKSINQNQTGWSVEASATTLPEGVICVDDDASPGG